MSLLLTEEVCNSVTWQCLRIGADNEEVEEVKSKPAKAGAKPTKKPVLPDSVKAITKASPPHYRYETMHECC